MTTIVDIRWDRIYLEFELEGIIDLNSNFLIRSIDLNQEYPVSCIDNLIRINITNVTGIRNNEMLKAGGWELVQKCSGVTEILQLATEISEKLGELSNVFPYGKHKYAYAVSFETKVVANQNTCLIYSMYLKENKKPRKEYLFLEAETPKEFLIQATTRAVVVLIRCIYFFASRFRTKNCRHILLMSETKECISGNLLSLKKWMLQNRPQYILAYSFHETLNMRKSSVVFYWIKFVWLLAKQDIIIVDDYAPLFKVLNLHKKTKLIQVWHAGVGFKSVGYSRFGKEDSPRPFMSAHRKYDYAIVGSTNLVPIYAEVFGIKESSVIPLGLPKIDDFLDPSRPAQCIAELTNKHNIMRDKKIMLFAPTYRGAGQYDANYPLELIKFSKIFDICGSEFIFAIKMHPFIQNKIDIPEMYKDRIIDVSEDNIDDLLHVADLLISDYSSVIYEFSLLDKPMLFFAYDKEEYQANRGFHWDYEENVPGKICRTFDDLLTSIDTQDYCTERIHKFRDFGFEYHDRMACQRFCKFMDVLLDNQCN